MQFPQVHTTFLFLLLPHLAYSLPTPHFTDSITIPDTRHTQSVPPQPQFASDVVARAVNPVIALAKRTWCKAGNHWVGGHLFGVCLPDVDVDVGVSVGGSGEKESAKEPVAEEPSTSTDSDGGVDVDVGVDVGDEVGVDVGVGVGK